MLPLRPKSWSSGLLLGLWLGVVPVANAQTSADNKAAAEALFDQGLTLLKNGDYEEACQRLSASQSIDPGVGTLLYLGECYEKLGKTASAWATFREASSAAEAAGQGERAQIGKERASRLVSKLTYLRVELDRKLEEISDVEVLRGESLVPKALWGAPMPVDPGEHVLHVRAPGYEPARVTVTCEGEGATETVRLPALEPSAGAALAPRAEAQNGAASVPPAAALGPPEQDAPRDGNVQRTTGLVLAGAGVVGVGIGSFFGLRAIAKNREAEASCTGSRCLTNEGVDLTSDALSAARTSNIAFLAGGAALAGGLVLYFTAPRRQEVTRLEMVPTVGGAQVQLGRSF